jgi:CRISPR system Cascade subunit CasE
LAYSQHSKAALLDQACTFAEPVAQAVCVLEQDLAVAIMPNPERWSTGRRLGFEVLICPTARRARSGTERDVFLYQADQAAAGLDRAQVYAEWLATQLQGAARIERVNMQKFQLVSQWRQGQKPSQVKRTSARLIRPAALLAGVLEVVEGMAFHHLLGKGLGRHKAFGYGMLLLRPV